MRMIKCPKCNAEDSIFADREYLASYQLAFDGTLDFVDYIKDPNGSLLFSCDQCKRTIFEKEIEECNEIKIDYGDVL